MIKIETALLIIIGILLFEAIVFIHEFGHFITAKKSGVKVNEFAIGMGPKILKHQKGETLYSLRLFPIGGFCAMEGEDQNSDDERAFINKPVWKKIIIVAAGAIMNIILGFILMMITLAPNENFASTKIAVFADKSVSSQTLKVGDELKKVNGYDILTSGDISFALATATSNEMPMTIIRDGKSQDINVKFGTVEKDGKDLIQIDFKVEPIKNNFGTLISQTFKSTVSVVKMVWASLFGLITGQFGFNELAGPIGMTDAISQAAAAGLQSSFWDGLNNLIYIMTIITVNLGVVNLLPLPALDGGRLVFLIIEAIRRKRINPEVEGYIHGAGLVLLMLFMVIVSINDVIRLFS